MENDGEKNMKKIHTEACTDAIINMLKNKEWNSDKRNEIEWS